MGNRILIFVASCVLFLAACAPDQLTRLDLTIIQPRDVNPIDTIHTLYIPVEGIVTVGAIIRISGTQSDTGIRLYPDASGHFTGQLPIPDQDADYSAVFTAKMDTRMTQESRTVHYKHLP